VRSTVSTIELAPIIFTDSNGISLMRGGAPARDGKSGLPHVVGGGGSTDGGGGEGGGVSGGGGGEAGGRVLRAGSTPIRESSDNVEPTRVYTQTKQTKQASGSERRRKRQKSSSGVVSKCLPLQALNCTARPSFHR